MGAKQVQEVLKDAPNIVLVDNPEQKLYPMPITATSTDQTFVGRVRGDLFDPHTLHLWCVADQLRVECGDKRRKDRPGVDQEPLGSCLRVCKTPEKSGFLMPFSFR